MEKRSLITLTTDFGNKEPFVGIMQGVMLGINPFLQFVDLSHGIEPHNILQAAYVIDAAYSFFPAGTIHLVVVDPDVGSNRKILMVKSHKYCFVAPDNGVLSTILNKEKKYEIYQLDPEKFITGEISATFHGRDIFAPAVAYFSLNQAPTLLGHKVDSPIELNLPIPKKVGSHSFSGEIIHIDRFGNLISNFSSQFLRENIGKQAIKIKIGPYMISGLEPHYSNARPGEISALINSWNNIEIFLNLDSAAKFLKAKVGNVVEITREKVLKN